MKLKNHSINSLLLLWSLVSLNDVIHIYSEPSGISVDRRLFPVENSKFMPSIKSSEQSHFMGTFRADAKICHYIQSMVYYYAIMVNIWNARISIQFIWRAKGHLEHKNVLLSLRSRKPIQWNCLLWWIGVGEEIERIHCVWCGIMSRTPKIDSQWRLLLSCSRVF